MQDSSRHRGRPAGLFAGLLLTGALLASAALAAPRDRDDEPRLSLPGGWQVTPGQVLDLAWSAADSVRELEILLSVDGGRQYATAISPQLDPRTRRFRWRVPNLPGTRLRLRIRYNRGGREIEGPPTPMLRADAGGAGEPLGLPPFSDAGEGRQGNRTEAPARSAGDWAADEPRSGAGPRGAAGFAQRWTTGWFSACSGPAAVSRASAQPSSRPRFVPLRA